MIHGLPTIQLADNRHLPKRWAMSIIYYVAPVGIGGSDSPIEMRIRLEAHMMITNFRRSGSLVILIAVVVGLQLPSAVQAQYTYVTNNSAITITGYTGAGGALTVSNSLNGLPVVSINDAVFQNLSSLTSVTIPSSITHIGQNAFAGCINLTAFTLDPGNSAYSSLDGVLFNKDQTTLIQCPGAKTGSYRIPSTVTSVGSAAFQYSANLTGVIIPPSVTSIGSAAFEYFGKLVVVTISASVTNIGAFAFDGCDQLTTITVDSSNPVYSSQNGVLFNKDQTILLQCPGGRTGNFIIPSGVLSIGPGAFGWDRYLSSVTIPEGVTNIGSQAFMYCYLLTGVTLPASLTSIGADCMLMAVTHVAHDCALGNGVVVANNAVMGGHVVIGDNAVIGGAAAIHQFVRIGRAAMIGGVSGVEADVVPFGMVIGNRGRLSGLNVIGLRRRGFDRAQIHAVRAAFHEMFWSPGVFATRVAAVRARSGDDPLIGEILAFMDAPSKRGLIRSGVAAQEDEAG